MDLKGFVILCLFMVCIGGALAAGQVLNKKQKKNSARAEPAVVEPTVPKPPKPTPAPPTPQPVEPAPTPPPVAPDEPQPPVPAAEPEAPGRVLKRLRKTTPAIRKNATRILKETRGQPYGTEVPFEADGKRYVARIERHYHEPGGARTPWGWHPGISVFEVLPSRSGAVGRLGF